MEYDSGNRFGSKSGVMGQEGKVKKMKDNNQEYDMGRLNIRKMTTRGNIPESFNYNFKSKIGY